MDDQLNPSTTGEVVECDGPSRLYRLYLQYLMEEAAYVTRGLQIGPRASAVIETEFAPLSETDFATHLTTLSVTDRTHYERRLELGFSASQTAGADHVARILEARLASSKRSDEHSGQCPDSRS